MEATVPKPTKPQCGDCIWFDRRSSNNTVHGLCRASLPNPSISTRWVEVRRDDYCRYHDTGRPKSKEIK